MIRDLGFDMNVTTSFTAVLVPELVDNIELDTPFHHEMVIHAHYCLVGHLQGREVTDYQFQLVEPVLCDDKEQ